MQNRTLMRFKPYKVSSNGPGENSSMRIALHPYCGYENGDEVYQVKREDGVIELIPKDKFDEKTLSVIK